MEAMRKAKIVRRWVYMIAIDCLCDRIDLSQRLA